MYTFVGFTPKIVILEYEHYVQEVAIANWDKHYTICMGIAIRRTFSIM